MNKARKVVILGGGISGLAAAWFLRIRGLNVTILEAGPKVGGYIKTVRESGFLFEMGPRSCRAQGNGQETLALIEQLGLQQEVVVAAPCARKRFLYTQHRLQPLPTGFFSFLTSPLTRPLLWPLLCEWRVPSCDAEDESVHSFIERRLGTYAANTFIDPLVSGIYAGNTQRLSVKSCFPFLHRCERDQGSLIKGLFSRRSPGKQSPSPFVQQIAKQGIFSFKQGMQQLTDALQYQLKNCIYTDCAAISVDFDAVTVSTADGRTIAADHIISALPAKALARLVQPHEPEAARLLGDIEYASVAVVALGYRCNLLDQQGFGYLIPSQEGERALGVVWDSSVFPQQNSHPAETRLTCMIGGGHMPNFDSYEPEDFVAIAMEAVARHLGKTLKPDAVSVKLAWRAIPQYGVGHERRVMEIRRRLGALTLLGSSFDGVAVNDCVANAKVAVDGIVLAFS